MEVGAGDPSGLEVCCVRHALRAHGGPRRTDFKHRQAISLDPSGTLNSTGLFCKSRNPNANFSTDGVWSFSKVTQYRFNLDS